MVVSQRTTGFANMSKKVTFQTDGPEGCLGKC